MNDKPFVSVIIPFYNTPEKAFRRCMQSVLGQTNGNFEAVVINDGSSPEFGGVLQEIAALDSRIRLINKQNEGVSVARNVGIREAQCEYIMFLDSDDALTPFCLEEAAKAVESFYPDLVIGGVKRVSEEEIDVLNPAMDADARILRVEPGEARDSLICHMIGLTDGRFSLQNGYISDGPVARMLKKSIASGNLFPKEWAWNEDTIWNIKLLRHCESIVIIDDLWYKYLIYAGSSVRKFRPNCPHEFRYITEQEIQAFREHWPNYMEGVYNWVFNDVTILGRTFLFHPDNPMTGREKYKIYRECIHQDAYREALKGLNLKKEKRVAHRIMKELLRFTAYYGPNFISYLILWLFYQLRKNAL